MRIAGFAVVLFATAFFIHWLVWRIRIPRRQTAALLVIFLGTLLVAFMVTAWLAPSGWFWPSGFWAWLQITFFHLAVALAYIVIYSALEESSPTLTIVTFVWAAGKQGRAVEEIKQIINDALILQSRLQAMIRDGLLVCTGAGYQLTPKGRAWASVFAFSRSLLRMRKGG